MINGLLNPTHIAILLIVVLLVLGPKKLPDTGRSLGRAMREFRDGITGRENPPTDTQTNPPPHAVAADPPPPALAAPPPPEPATPATGETAAVTVPQAAAPATTDERTQAA